jgi:hypothetical protein
MLVILLDRTASRETDSLTIVRATASESTLRTLNMTRA